MAIYNVFESTNMKSTRGAARIFDAVSDVDIENGTFGYLNGLAEGESHIYNFTAGTKAGETVIVADQPAWDEDTCRRTNQRRDKFVIKAGTPFRVREVAINDEFATAIEGFTSDTKAIVTDTADFAATDVFVTIDSTGKLVASNSTTADAVMEGHIERKRTVGGTLETKANTYGHSKPLYEVRVKKLA